jgi:hypothetical protein
MKRKKDEFDCTGLRTLDVKWERNSFLYRYYLLICINFKLRRYCCGHFGGFPALLVEEISPFRLCITSSTNLK